MEPINRLRWPASSRNGGRHQIGTLAGIKSESPAGLRATAAALRNDPSPAAAHLAVLYDNLADFREVARLERDHIENLRATLAGDAALAYVPYLAHDVYDFGALHEVGRHLFDTVPVQ